MKRQLISSGTTFEEKIAYSRAVIDGDHVYVSGTTGYDYSTMMISNDVVAQAEQCFKNIKNTLYDAGSSLSQIVRVQYILPNRDDFKLCWPVFQKYLRESRPAATMFVAGLLNDEIKIEIEVTARVIS